MRLVAAIAALAAVWLPTAAVAQMRPGAKVEKTYGLGLPRDMDKLAPDERRSATVPCA